MGKTSDLSAKKSGSGQVSPAVHKHLCVDQSFWIPVTSMHRLRYKNLDGRVN